MFSGISQTTNDPAAHSEFEYAYTNDLFAGIWGSNLDSGDGRPLDDEVDLEINLYLGYGTSLNDDWTLDATAIRYIFPHTAPVFDLNDAPDDSYFDWRIGVETGMGMFTARLAYADTDNDGLFGGNKVDARLFFSVTVEFSQ